MGIEIVSTGLRPGGVYEDLLTTNLSPRHPLIYRANGLPPHEIWPKMDSLERAIAAQDFDTALELLSALVPEWQRATAT